MDFRITSTTNNRSQHQAGFTIVENWVALGLAGLVTLTICSFTIFSSKSFAGMSNYVDLEKSSQNAIDTMTRDIRQTVYLSQYQTNCLTFLDSDDKPLIFEYSPTSRTLTRKKNGVDKVLLTECDFLSFGIFQRNPVGGTYDQYPTATATNCKLINVSWVCSRKILGSKLNTESVQTAKIVIRKQ